MVAKILTSIGYTPVWQDIASTEAGNLTEVLHSRIKLCAAVVQLVGFRYGAEPREPDPQFGRVSYTQLEALYAEQIGKKVIYIFLPQDFPTDPCDPESEEKSKLQLAYRQQLKESGSLRHSASNQLELENRVLRIRDDLAILRAEMEKSRRRVRWAATVALLLLIGVGFGIWRLSRASRRQEVTLSGVKQAGEEQKKALTKQVETSKRIESKVDEIRSLPASVRADRLISALASANAAELFLLREAGITAAEVQNAFARKYEGGDETVARRFFSNSKNNDRATEWLRLVLKDGLDPNMTIPHPYFENEALLFEALAPGNAKGTVALLEGGASPHGYEGLWLTTPRLAAFLFPYSYLIDNEELSAEEKQTVAKAMRKAGAIVLTQFPSSDPRWASFDDSVQREDIEKVASKSKELFGFQLQPSPPFAERVSPIAVMAKKRGQDWTTYLQTMPIRLYLQSDRREDAPIWIELRGFLGTYFDRGYFLAMSNYNGRRFALVEVSKDHRVWNIYMYVYPEGGKGIAKGENGKQEYGSRRPAWRLYKFKVETDGQMLLDDFYKYTTTRDLTQPLTP